MFYDQFIRLCNSVGKSPTAVAKEMGLSGAHVNRWKNGSKPTDTTILKVCAYFGLPHNYFEASSTKKAPAQRQKLSDEDIKFALFNGDNEISDEAYEEVKAFAEFVRQKYKKGK